LFGWSIEKWAGRKKLPERIEYGIVTTTDDKGTKSLTGRYDEKTK
jgi:hypothetical protein